MRSHTIAPFRTSLVGREHDVQVLFDLLQCADVRSVTVTGPGGIGKTVVAEAACRRLGACAPVPFLTIALQGSTGVADGQTLVAALAGASPDAGPHPSTMPRGRRRIVLIDGAETSPTAAQAVSKALDDDSGLLVLATSVVPLGIRGEHVVRLGPLATPPPGLRAVAAIGTAPAVQLFCARLEAADPDFDFDASTAVAVAELCIRLDGHPLALELAAARCATSTVAAVLEHFDRASPLVVLTQRARDGAVRHRSLHDTVEWTVRLLDDDQRTLLRHACAFAGSFTWEALLAVAELGGAPPERDAAEGVLEHLDVLVATGTVRRVAAPCAGDGDRYAVTTAVRDYIGHLGSDPVEANRLRRRHTEYYRDLARGAAAQHWSAQHGSATRTLVLEQRELLQALDEVSATDDVASALAFAVDLEALWIGIGAAEMASERLAGLLDRSRTADTGRTLRALIAEATASLAALTCWSRPSDIGSADRARLTQAVAVARESEQPELVLRTMVTALRTDILAGDSDGARVTADAAIEIAVALGHDWWRMKFLSLSAAAANQAGNAHLAVEHAIAARDLARALGDEHQLVLTSHVLTGIPGAAGDPRAAVPSPDDLLAMARRLGDVQIEGMVLISSAIRHARAGDAAVAARNLHAALACGRPSGFWYLEELALFVLVPIAAGVGRYEEAAKLSGALHDVLTDTRRRASPGTVAEYAAALDRTREVLGASAVDELVAGGRLLRWSDALEYAEALVALLAVVEPGARNDRGESDRLRQSRPCEHTYGLTDRELDVLRGISSGASNKDIALALGLRPKTVMHYAGTVYRKLGVSSRTEALTVAWKSGLLDDSSRVPPS